MHDRDDLTYIEEVNDVDYMKELNEHFRIICDEGEITLNLRFVKDDYFQLSNPPKYPPSYYTLSIKLKVDVPRVYDDISVSMFTRTFNIGSYVPNDRTHYYESGLPLQVLELTYEIHDLNDFLVQLKDTAWKKFNSSMNSMIDNVVKDNN